MKFLSIRCDIDLPRSVYAASKNKRSFNQGGINIFLLTRSRLIITEVRGTEMQFDEFPGLILSKDNASRISLAGKQTKINAKFPAIEHVGTTRS